MAAHTAAAVQFTPTSAPAGSQGDALRISVLLDRVPCNVADDYNQWITVGLAVKQLGDRFFTVGQLELGRAANMTWQRRSANGGELSPTDAWAFTMNHWQGQG